MTDPRTAAPERVVVVLFRSGGVKRVNAYAADVAARGVRVTALVADGQGWNHAPPLHPDVEVYSLRRAENRGPILWTYVTLVERIPGGILRRLEERLPGPLGRAAHVAARAHRKAAGVLRKRVFWPVYRPLRSHVLRRRALRRLDALDLDTAARVVCADESTIPFGWSLARRRPDLEVTRALNSAVYDDRPVVAPRSTWDPGEPGAADRPPYTQL